MMLQKLSKNERDSKKMRDKLTPRLSKTVMSNTAQTVDRLKTVKKACKGMNGTNQRRETDN